MTTSQAHTISFVVLLQLVKELKVEGPQWVSKYARGGNVRATSARKFYIVIDALSGHFASNG